LKLRSGTTKSSLQPGGKTRLHFSTLRQQREHVPVCRSATSNPPRTLPRQKALRPSHVLECRKSPNRRAEALPTSYPSSREARTPGETLENVPDNTYSRTAPCASKSRAGPEPLAGLPPAKARRISHAAAAFSTRAPRSFSLRAGLLCIQPSSPGFARLPYYGLKHHAPAVVAPHHSTRSREHLLPPSAPRRALAPEPATRVALAKQSRNQRRPGSFTGRESRTRPQRYRQVRIIVAFSSFRNRGGNDAEANEFARRR
jgi:hypothetical protein